MPDLLYVWTPWELLGSYYVLEWLERYYADRLN